MKKSIFFCLVALIYFLLPIIYYGLGYDIIKQPLAPGDAGIAYYPFHIFNAQMNSLWVQNLMSGMSVFWEPQFQSFYLPKIIFYYLFPDALGYNLLLFFHYSLAGFFTFLFLQKLNLNRTASFIGGLCFMFCGFMVAHKGHLPMISSSAWLPVVLFFVESYYKDKNRSNLFFASIAFSMTFYAGYIASPMYIGMVVFPYICFRILTENGLNNLENYIKIVKYSSVVFIIGLLLGSIVILPLIEMLMHAARTTVSYSFFASYSFPFKALPILLFPYFYGTHSPGFYPTPYFGPWNLGEIAGYMGILPLLLAILAFVLYRKLNNQIYFWSFVAVTGFILVLGDSLPIHKIMYHVPIYNMFRASARNWLIVNFAVAVLTAFGIHYIINTTHEKLLALKKAISNILVIVIVMFVLIFSIIFSFDSLLNNVIISSIKDWVGYKHFDLLLFNINISSPVIYVPFIIIIVSTIIFFLSCRLNKYKNYWIAVSIVIFFDLFSFGHFHDTGYFPQQNNEDIILTKLDGNISKYRVYPMEMNLPGYYPEQNLFFNINTINAYSSMWLRDFKKLTTFETHGIASKSNNLLIDPTILSICSVKYIVTGDKDNINLLEHKRDSSAASMIISSQNFEEWENYNSLVDDKKFILKSDDGKNVSLVQQKIKIEKNKLYIVRFNAKSELKTKGSLFVDFYNKGYDNPDQEEHFKLNSFSGSFKENTAVFMSGDSPEYAYLRFFTFSKYPVEIKDISISEISKKWLIKNSEMYKMVSDHNGIAIYENNNFLDRARFVSNTISVKNFNEAKSIIETDETFNPGTTAIVEDYNGPSSFMTGEVVSVDYTDNDKIKIIAKTEGATFLVLSDVYYPGWRAYVDGKETKIYKTNGTFRGVIIEKAGVSNITFEYRPMSFYSGIGITVVIMLILFIIILKDYKMKTKRD